jgi:anti-sigma-K factor RskA/putative zinc finger protein
MSANEHDRRLEEVAAFALGALDPAQLDEFREHLDGCRRCQEELRRLEPAVRVLPEGVEQRSPSPELKLRLMEEVRADIEAERRERSSARRTFGEWLRGVRLGGLTWKPLAGLAVVILIVAGGIGYLVGNGGGSNVQTTEVKQENGIVATVVTEGGHGELRLTGVGQLPQGKVLEAWVQRGEAVEPVEALFTPDDEGNATTTIDDMSGVGVVMVTREPQGGTKAPTTKPIVEVPLEG